jgi:2-methylisocitrate lyase-like PEP mutase family enzyme
MHPPTAAHAQIMEKAGRETLFVRTRGVVGAYTGLSDVGTATMTECVTIAGWIADSVSIPVMIDGDTGHGGITAVRRMVRECIRAGIAGIRLDDQPIEASALRRLPASRSSHSTRRLRLPNTRNGSASGRLPMPG